MVFENFSPKLQKILDERGFKEPTLPQKEGIPDIMAGRNVLIIAPTGHGKTETSMLPLLDKISRKKHKPVSVLYINPLRSLSRDLLDRLYWWADKLELEISVRHGDTTQAERAAQRDTPPDCLITTPESLGAMMLGKKMRDHLKNVKYVVIDEVHEMAGNKRGTHLSLLLERLHNLCGNFQRIGLSATVGNAEDVAKFIGPSVKVIRAEGVKKYDISVEMPLPTQESHLMAQRLFMHENTVARLMRIRELIHANNSVLTFTNTRQTAEVLSSRFKTLGEKTVDVHHGSLSKESRISAEKRFKGQEIKALIATSSLELGIDIGSIDLVIQYLSPRQVSKFIQRAGRAGHAAGKISKGIIITGDDDVFESAAIARKAVRKEIEDIRIHENAIDVLAMQIIGMAMEEPDIRASSIYTTIKRAYAFRELTSDKFTEIVKFLGNMRLLWLNPVYEGAELKDFMLKKSMKGFHAYFENLSTISETRQIRIVSIVENEPIGMLDESFIAEHGDVGNTFVCSGRAWKVLAVEERKVLVEPVDDIESSIPAWEGELIPVPYAVASEVGRLRKMAATGESMEDYPVDETCRMQMKSVMKGQKIIPDEKNILVETYKDFIIIHACFGTRTNDTIGKYLAAELTNRTGVAVNIKTDPYRIILQTIAKADELKKIFADYGKLKEMLEFTIAQSSLFKYRFMHVARRFGVISKSARLDKISINRIVSQFSGTPLFEETMREIFLDKMNLERADDVLSGIKSGSIDVIFAAGLSPLGQAALEYQFSEVMKPKRPEKEIFEAFRNRLMHTRMKLICTSCSSYSLSKEVRDIDERPQCPKCKSLLIAVTSPFRHIEIKNLKKDSKELKELRRSADLMVTYGRKYAMVQAGRGVGVETAARVLAKLPDTEEKLLKYIYEAEKNFARTKIYWKS